MTTSIVFKWFKNTICAYWQRILIIVFAHRINTVKGADHILVLDKGSILDIGTHEELMKRCDLYKKLCKKMK